MAKKKEEPDEKLPTSFEEAFAALTEIVRKLEGGQENLTEMTRLFEEGVRLSRFCAAELDAIERKIEILLGGDGDEAVPFEESQGESV